MLCKSRPASDLAAAATALRQLTALQLLLSKKRSHRYSRPSFGEEEEEAEGSRFRSPKQDPDGHYFRLHKSKGQHILTNPRVLDSIVRKASVKPKDVVLEIGPGTGNLTLKLLEAASKVVAVEIDKRMVDVLVKRVGDNGFQDKLTVIQKDALKTHFPPFDIVVANIPYGISSPLIAKLVYGTNRFRSATLLLQKEFARRLLANPGDSEFNRLAVNVKLVADVEFVMDVSKRDFVPAPKVDSSVVIIRPKAEIPDVNLNEWWAFTRTCFSKKNKTLGATFKQKRKLKEIFMISKLFDETKEISIINNIDSPFGLVEQDDFDIEEAEETASQASPVHEEEMSSFREKIISVLRAGAFEDKRPSKLSNDELLHLLSLLNGAGVYFHKRAKQDTGNVPSSPNYE